MKADMLLNKETKPNIILSHANAEDIKEKLLSMKVRFEKYSYVERGSKKMSMARY